MPSSYTPSLRLVLPVTAELTGTWGSTVNTGITSLVDAAIAGTANVTMTDANYTLTAVNEGVDEARQMFIRLTGTLSLTRNVICPAVSKLYFVANETTGGQSIVFKTPSGTGVTVANGQRVMLYCNGTNVVSGINSLTANLTGDITGNITGNVNGNINGNVTGDVTGNVTGNSGTATSLQTARTLWGQSFNGTANVTGALSSVTTLAMSGQLTNTVSTGTAPFVVSSTTRVANLNVATAGTADTATSATNATNVAVTTSSTSSAFKVPFANTTANTTGNYGLLQDSEATFTYNPSTNTLTVGTVAGALSGNASTVTNGVYTTGDQTIGGTKTFSSTIVGSINGNAGTVTNGVYTTGNQTIAGTKTFSAAPVSANGFVLSAAGWSIIETGGVLFFRHNGVNRAKLDSSGNFTVAGNVTAFGTV
jgi:hypothetical protein